jgi:hypothetical protein
MKWIKWVCEPCGRMNQSSVNALPTTPRIDPVCRECRVKSHGVAWSETSAPERTANAEGGHWQCPFCKARNDVPTKVEGPARLKCSVCDQTCSVLLLGGFDAPAGPTEP